MFGFQWTRKTPKGYAPLAQLVEQLTLNQWVRGSSPRRCTKSGNRVPKSVFLSQRVHPFPFRTRKLSSAEPKILAWRRAGTIGHCRHLARATVLAAKGNMGMHSDTPLVSLYFYSSLAQSVERTRQNARKTAWFSYTKTRFDRHKKLFKPSIFLLSSVGRAPDC